jgi:hypothetical protein
MFLKENRLPLEGFVRPESFFVMIMNWQKQFHGRQISEEGKLGGLISPCFL